MTALIDSLYRSSFLIAVVFLSCTGSVYQLPDNPPVNEARSSEKHGSSTEDTNSRDFERFVQAKQAVLELYKLLSQKRYREAIPLLSQQTRSFLSHGSETDSAAGALAAGKLRLSEDRSIELEPVEFLLARNISDIRDAVDGYEENETDRRKELFLETESGEVQNVVVIEEGGKWVLHKTGIKVD